MCSNCVFLNLVAAKAALVTYSRLIVEIKLLCYNLVLKGLISSELNFYSLGLFPNNRNYYY
jgi:hypothetical protein